MITRMAPLWQTESWQKSLAEAIRDPADLLKRLDLPDELLPAARQAARRFPLRVPMSYVNRIEKGNPHDPLLRQVLPLQAELAEPAEGYSTDPVGDLLASPVPGLIHKYRGRVLLIATGACAIHCRYCFRRHFPYGESCTRSARLDEILAYIGADESIEEIILSGGDPLSLSTHRLRELGDGIARLPHVKRLRFHTRLPIVLPERIDAPLLDWLNSLSLQLVMVVHSNHAREINGPVRQALSVLRGAGLSLLNQAVLLKGVNDSVAALRALSEALFTAGVMPYYLHQLDRVAGAQHFEVRDETALALVSALGQVLPGYLVPKLVREVQGAPAKLGLSTNPL